MYMYANMIFQIDITAHLTGNYLHIHSLMSFHFIPKSCNHIILADISFIPDER